MCFTLVRAGTWEVTKTVLMGFGFLWSFFVWKGDQWLTFGILLQLNLSWYT